MLSFQSLVREIVLREAFRREGRNIRKTMVSVVFWIKQQLAEELAISNYQQQANKTLQLWLAILSRSAVYTIILFLKAFYFTLSYVPLPDWTASEPEGLPAGWRHANQNHSGPGATSLQLQAA